MIARHPVYEGIANNGLLGFVVNASFDMMTRARFSMLIGESSLSDGGLAPGWALEPPEDVCACLPNITSEVRAVRPQVG